jgi:hypothetical protein
VSALLLAEQVQRQPALDRPLRPHPVYCLLYLPILRTDNASLIFFRQRIAQFLSPRTDNASLRLMAEAHAVRDVWGLVHSRSSAACVRELVLVTMPETSQIGRKTGAALLDHRPPAPFARDAPVRQCRGHSSIGQKLYAKGRRGRVSRVSGVGVAVGSQAPRPCASDNPRSG